MAALDIWIHVPLLFCSDLCVRVFYSDGFEDDGVYDRGCVFAGEFGYALMREKCAPLYLFSAILTVAVAWIADRTKLRMPYMVLNAVITLVGLLLTAYDRV